MHKLVFMSSWLLSTAVVKGSCLLMQTSFPRTERVSGYCKQSCKMPSSSSAPHWDTPRHTTYTAVWVLLPQTYYWKYWELARGFALWPSIPCVHGIDFSSLLPQVGMNDLTVVNLHLALPASAGDNTGKNHDSHKLAACAQTLQETLKGRAGVFLPASTCTQSNWKEFLKE